MVVWQVQSILGVAESQGNTALHAESVGALDPVV